MKVLHTLIFAVLLAGCAPTYQQPAQYYQPLTQAQVNTAIMADSLSQGFGNVANIYGQAAAAPQPMVPVCANCPCPTGC